MTVMNGDDPALPEQLTDEEEEAMSAEALVYEVAVMLMRLEDNDGDPHRLLWEGGPVREPWGDAWQRYEPQSRKVIEAIGEPSARVLVNAPRAFEIADVAMFELLLSAGVPGDAPAQDATCIGFTDESCNEVTKLEAASTAMREAFEWLRLRDYVELATDGSGEYAAVLRRPGEPG